MVRAVPEDTRTEADGPVEGDVDPLAGGDGADPGDGGSALFDGYLEPERPNADAFDEMFHADGRVRAAYRALHDAIAPTAVTDLAVRSEALDRAYLDQG